MPHPLSGKVAIVTGASSGIGRATARALSRCGARVALAARSAEKLSALAAELGPDALALVTDVTRGAEVTRMVEETVRRFSRVDILFANAGQYVPGEVAEGDPEAWARMVDVNVNGVLRSVRAVLPHIDRTGRRGHPGHELDLRATRRSTGNRSTAPPSMPSRPSCTVCDGKWPRTGCASERFPPGIVLNELWEAHWGPLTAERIAERVHQHEGLRSEDVAEEVIHVLSLPRHVTIRDLVILPQNQDI